MGTKITAARRPRRWAQLSAGTGNIPVILAGDTLGHYATAANLAMAGLAANYEVNILYGGVEDLAFLPNVGITSGSAILSTPNVFTTVDNGKAFVGSWLKMTPPATINANSTTVIVSAVPSAGDINGPVWIDYDGTVANAFKTNLNGFVTNSSNTSTLTLMTAAPTSGTHAVHYGNYSQSGTLVVNGTSASMSGNATVTCGFGWLGFGTDNRTSLAAACAAAVNSGKPVPDWSQRGWLNPRRRHNEQLPQHQHGRYPAGDGFAASDCSHDGTRHRGYCLSVLKFPAAPISHAGFPTPD